MYPVFAGFGPVGLLNALALVMLFDDLIDLVLEFIVLLAFLAIAIVLENEKKRSTRRRVAANLDQVDFLIRFVHRGFFRSLFKFYVTYLTRL